MLFVVSLVVRSVCCSYRFFVWLLFVMLLLVGCCFVWCLFVCCCFYLAGIGLLSAIFYFFVGCCWLFLLLFVYFLFFWCTKHLVAGCLRAMARFAACNVIVC